MTELKETLIALSEEIRVRILLMLWDSKVCVNCLTQVLKRPQSTISRHLAVLRRCRLVGIEKDRTNNYYFVKRHDAIQQRLIEGYYIALRDVEPFKSDIIRLEETIKAEGCRVGEGG